MHILSLLIVFLLSCLPTSSSQAQSAPMNLESFVTVYVKQTYSTNSPVCTDIGCEDSEILLGESLSQGSGASIAQKFWKERSAIITAGHLCEEFNKEIPDEMTYLFSDTKVISVMYIMDYEGRYYKASMGMIDKANDICIIYVDKRIPSLRLGLAPKHGDVIYNEAAPLDLSFARAIPVFDGYYSGTVEDTSTGFKKALYTIPGHSGSSGSPVVNDSGNLIGTITSVIVDFPHITTGPDYESVKLAVKWGHQNL